MNRIEEIKIELKENIESGKVISKESSEYLLNMLESITKKPKESKDSAPMIGNNPFKKEVKVEKTNNKSNKSLLDSLNYRVK